MKNTFSVRELTRADIVPLVNYWLGADNEFLTGMGCDVCKMPTEKEWHRMLNEQLRTPLEEKKSYCIIWLIGGKPAGHSNINKIIFGNEAYMHLHLWNTAEREKGAGTALVRMTLPYFFENYRLQKLFCEPYALNAAPNKVLEKAGFRFVKEYITTPNQINFEQPVKRWEMSAEAFQKMKR